MKEVPNRNINLLNFEHFVSPVTNRVDLFLITINNHFILIILLINQTRPHSHYSYIK